MRGIYNESKKTFLAKRFKTCKSYWSKARGLMFSKIKPLVFYFNSEKIIWLHSMFVREPIDLVFLDKNNVVVELKPCFKPYNFYVNKNKAAMLLELPMGTINSSKTDVGDKIVIK